VDIRSQQLFLILADTLNFSRAAEQLHMSLSAVSRTVQRLESECGQRLFERDKRSVRLTPAGERFREYAEGAVSDWQQLRAALHVDPGHLRGQVSIYCSVTASYSVISPILAPFRAEHAGIDIMLHTGDQADAISRIAGGLEDVAVAASPDDLPRKLEFLTLMQSPLRFIAPDFDCGVTRLLADNPVEKLAEVPFIVAERGLSKQRVDAWFRARGQRPRIYAQVSGHEAIAAMVGLGLGVGVVPRVVLDNFTHRDQVRVLPVDVELGPFPVGLCASGQRLENPLVAALWDTARRSYPASR
jgi:LysR family positive regulator for ilvC